MNAMNLLRKRLMATTDVQCSQGTTYRGDAGESDWHQDTRERTVSVRRMRANEGDERGRRIRRRFRLPQCSTPLYLRGSSRLLTPAACRGATVCHDVTRVQLRTISVAGTILRRCISVQRNYAALRRQSGLSNWLSQVLIGRIFLLVILGRV
jgi:hypothetical protein